MRFENYDSMVTNLVLLSCSDSLVQHFLSTSRASDWACYVVARIMKRLRPAGDWCNATGTFLGLLVQEGDIAYWFLRVGCEIWTLAKVLLI